MNKKILYGIGGLVIGVIITILVTSNMATNENPMQDAYSLGTHFIEQMIPHHEDAITMAKLAIKNATHPEIKQLAQNIIDSQEKEINLMKNWYKEWYDKEVPKNEQTIDEHGMEIANKMHMGMMGDERDIERLETADNFDKVFIEEMIPHHQMAVMMATMLKNGTSRPEMEKLADDIIAAQTKEINQMRKWYKDWGY